jgi:hypothetical protein
MKDKPDLRRAAAMAIVVAAGGVVISKALVEEIAALHARMKAGLATVAEIESIEEELREVPGFTAWESRQLLDRTLKKAFV